MANENKELQVQDVEKQEFSSVDGAERTRAVKAFVPHTDIYETDHDLIAVADMPGVDENSIEITLEKNILTIRGVVELVVPADYELAYAEYEVGDFERSFTLSNQIDYAKIEAAVKDGVLRVHLPKIGPAQTKKIAVKAA